MNGLGRTVAAGLLGTVVAVSIGAPGAASPVGLPKSQCASGKAPVLRVCLGLALVPVKSESAQAILTGRDQSRVRLSFFSASPVSLTAEFDFDGESAPGLSAGLALKVDGIAVGTLAFGNISGTGHASCRSDDPAVNCTLSDERLKTSTAAGHRLRWTGTVTVDVSQSLLLRGDPSKRVDHVVSEIVATSPQGEALQLCARQNDKTLEACVDPKPEKAITALPLTVSVVFDPPSDAYAPKGNADAKKIFDGIASLLRSRLGADIASDWNPWVRASLAFGQSSSDQTSAAAQSGQAIFAGALTNKDVVAGAAAAAGAVLDGDKKKGDSAKDGFLATDSSLLSFRNLAAPLSAALSGNDVLTRDLKDTTAGVTPFDLSRLIAPDGAVKIVARNDVPGARGWRLLGGVVFGAAVGDDPAGVADGAAVIAFSRSSPESSTTLTLAHAFANRTQTRIDLRDHTHVTSVPLTTGVSIEIPFPVARTVHVVNEGFQFSAEHDRGFSTYLRATGEPNRAGGDFYAAEQWRGGSRSPLVNGPGSRSTSYSVTGGWRGTGPDYDAPTGTANQLAGTAGPFVALHRDSLTIAPDQRRETSSSVYHSRWSSPAGVQQYVTRLDGLYDYRNRFGVTGSLTWSAATLALITREQVNDGVPLVRAALFPLNQGNAGLSWRPPNGELSVQDGYALTTACKNIVGTTELPKGVTLPKGSVLPRCQPQGSNTLSGTAKVVAGRLAAAVHYGAPTFAVSRTADVGASIERAGALRYRIGDCHVLQAEYVNRSGYEGLTDSAGSLWGASLELHTRLFGLHPVLTLSYARATTIPLFGSPQIKTAPRVSPDVFHQPDDKGC